MTTISSAVEIITPQIAALMLHANDDNRPVSQTIVAQMASDILAGRWAMTGQPIIVAADGQLNDGQHRLQAIVKSGMPVTALVVRGVPRESRVAIDTGRSRTPGDIATMIGLAQGTAVTGLARIVISYERAKGKTLGRPSDVSKAEILQRCKDDDRLLKSVHAGEAVHHVIKKKQAAFIWYMTPDNEAADEFFCRLGSGADLSPGNPILTFRNWLLRHGRLADYVAIEAGLRAWVAFRDRRQLQRLNILGELPEL